MGGQNGITPTWHSRSQRRTVDAQAATTRRRRAISAASVAIIAFVARVLLAPAPVVAATTPKRPDPCADLRQHIELLRDSDANHESSAIEAGEKDTVRGAHKAVRFARWHGQAVVIKASYSGDSTLRDELRDDDKALLARHLNEMARQQPGAGAMLLRVFDRDRDGVISPDEALAAAEHGAQVDFDARSAVHVEAGSGDGVDPADADGVATLDTDWDPTAERRWLEDDSASGLFPELVGVCDDVILVTFAKPLHSALRSSSDEAVPWLDRARYAQKALRLLHRLRHGRDGNELLMCDISAPNFGVDESGEVRIIDPDSVFAHAAVDAHLAAKRCTADMHCGVRSSCASTCNRATRRCDPVAPFSNIHQFCKKVLNRWDDRHNTEDPGLHVDLLYNCPVDAPELARALEVCVRPEFAESTPAAVEQWLASLEMLVEAISERVGDLHNQSKSVSGEL